MVKIPAFSKEAFALISKYAKIEHVEHCRSTKIILAIQESTMRNLQTKFKNLGVEIVPVNQQQTLSILNKSGQK